jgi:hypothetical protein
VNATGFGRTADQLRGRARRLKAPNKTWPAMETNRQAVDVETSEIRIVVRAGINPQILARSGVHQ